MSTAAGRDSLPVFPASVTVADPPTVEQLFAPTSGSKVLHEDEDDYSIPEDIVSILESQDLLRPSRVYQCMLKEISQVGETSANDQMASYIKSWRNSVPTIDWIAKNYGPGNYMLVFVFKKKDEETGRLKNFSEKVPITISEKFRAAYRKFQATKRISDLKEQQDKLKEARLDKYIDDQLEVVPTRPGESSSNPKEYVNEVLDFAGKMGLTQKRGFDFAALIPFVPLVIKYLEERGKAERERNEKWMMMMMQQSQSSSTALIELFRNHNGPASGSQMMEEWQKMLMGALDIKDALSGKESTVDKIFGMIERVAPMVLMMASVPKQARESMPQVKAAQAYIGSDPNFQEVLNDPRQRVALVRRLDAHYGWEQTDRILEVSGIERPQECPKLDAQRYPKGDERNVETAQEEQSEE